MGVPVAVAAIDPDDPACSGTAYRRRITTFPIPSSSPTSWPHSTWQRLRSSWREPEGSRRCGSSVVWWRRMARRRPRAALPGAAHLATLFGAISERRTVAFDYRGSRRRIDPYRLSFRNGHWYLAGHDHSRGEERSFRLDRIEGDVVGVGEADSFERRANAGRQPPPWLLGADEPVTARLLVDGEQAGWAISQLGPECGRGAQRRRLGRSRPCRSPTAPRSAPSCWASSITPRSSARPTARRGDRVAGGPLLPRLSAR